MKKPDRFDRMVIKSETYWETTPPIDIERDYAKLLRRQHAAYVRMVRHIGDTIEAGESGTSAITTVLAALARYRKGKS